MDQQIISPAVITALGALLGAVFGYVGSRTNFCTLGAISDIINMGSWARMRMWILAIAIAILGVWMLETAGLIDTSQSLYGARRLPWASHLIGGLMFGIGMTLASGCTSKALIRLGGGNLKSLLVFFVLGISAYMTLKGLFAVWRVASIDRLSIDLGTSQDLPSLLAAATGIAQASADRWVAPIVGLMLLVSALASRDLWRTERDAVVGGLVVGGVVVAAWYVTGHIAYVEEHPDTLEKAFIGTQSNRPESLSLVAPYAFSLELLMFWSDKSKHLTFGIATALGMVGGSLLYALTHGGWREEVFPDATDFKRHLLGAVLMGAGGITALGCTIGQGLSGLSTLSLGAIITTAAIIAGCALTLKVDYWRMMREA